jgi:hypothetical protein
MDAFLPKDRDPEDVRTNGIQYLVQRRCTQLVPPTKSRYFCSRSNEKRYGSSLNKAKTMK